MLLFVQFVLSLCLNKYANIILLGVSMHTVVDAQKYPDQATDVTKTTYQNHPASKVLNVEHQCNLRSREEKELQAMHK